jgi:hypothetical protein
MPQSSRGLWEGLKRVGRQIPGVAPTWQRLQRLWRTDNLPIYVPVSMNREQWNASYAQKNMDYLGGFRSYCAIAPWRA